MSREPYRARYRLREPGEAEFGRWIELGPPRGQTWIKFPTHKRGWEAQAQVAAKGSRDWTTAQIASFPQKPVLVSDSERAESCFQGGRHGSCDGAMANRRAIGSSRMSRCRQGRAKWWNWKPCERAGLTRLTSPAIFGPAQVRSVDREYRAEPQRCGHRVGARSDRSGGAGWADDGGLPSWSMDRRQCHEFLWRRRKIGELYAVVGIVARERHDCLCLAHRRRFRPGRIARSRLEGRRSRGW